MTDKPSIINRDTLIPIGVAIAIVVPIGVGISWLRDGQKDSSNEIQALRVEMSNRFDKIESRAADRWTGTQMQLWALQLQLDNPTVRVPKVQ